MTLKASKLHFLYISLLFLPIIAVSKIIRYTIMFRMLVGFSIGFGMVEHINKHILQRFHTSLDDFSQGGGSGFAYYNAEAFFAKINIFGFQTYLQWEVFFTIIFNLILFFLIRKFYETTNNITWKHDLFICMAIAILNIFCLNMSKEPYQLLFFLLLSIGLPCFKGYYAKNLWAIFVIALNILFARKYFVLVFAFFIATQFFVAKGFNGLDVSTSLGKKKLLGRIALVILLLAVFHFIMLHFIEQASQESYEGLIAVNDRSQTRKSVATSEIIPWFGSSNQILVTLEFFFKIFRLSCPIELLAIGKFTYIFLIVYQILLCYFIYKSFLLKKNATEEDDEDEPVEATSSIEKTDDDEEDDGNVYDSNIDGKKETKDRILNRQIATSFYIAFLLCSACFEPDFGSWTRHVGVTFPILLYIL